MTNRLRSWAAVGLAVLVPWGAVAQAPAKKLRFALDWAVQGPQAVFLTGAGAKCYKDSGIDVLTDRGYGSGDTITKVGAGTYDVGFADVNAMVEYNARNPSAPEIAIMIVYDGSPLSVTTLKDSKLTKPADLKGKTLAAPPGDASRRLFPIFAKTNGIDLATINWVNVAPEVRESLLARKGADAITGSSFTTYMGLRGANVPAEQISMMRFPDFGVDLFGSGIVVRRDFAATHGDALKAFLKCTTVGIKAALANPDGAIADLKKVDPLTVDAVEKERLKLSVDWSIMTPLVQEKGLSFVDPARLKKTFSQVADAFGVPAPAPADVYTDAYLPSRSDLMMTGMH